MKDEFMKKARSRREIITFSKKIKRLKYSSFVLGVLTLIYLSGKIVSNAYIFSPVSILAAPTRDVEIKIVEKETVKELPREDIDTWIGDAVDEFLPTHKSEARMIMHCLAHREAGHGASNAHGDGGLAGGPFQFHQETWDGYRRLMIKDGKATQTGSRYDFKEAARTTAWAISTGRAKAWGPILRDSNGSDFAACQYPSWYK